MAMNDRAGTLHVIAKEVNSPKKEVSIHQCEPGMQIAETIHNAQGVVVILEKTVLNASMLMRLENLGYARIKVFAPSPEGIVSDGRYEALYQACLENVQQIFDPVTSGKPLKPEQVKMACAQVCESTSSGHDFFRQAYRSLSVSASLQIHSLNTAMLAAYLHQWMKMNENLLYLTVQAALLHDIGKTKIKRHLMDMPGTLPKKEQEEWNRHPRLGWEIVNACRDMDSRIATIVATHHERPDGNGYPMRLRGSGIDPLARIIAVVDRFDNLTSGTGRERAVSPFRAFEILEQEAHTGFHLEETLAFLSQVPGYYIGDRFFLSSGDIGEILYINPNMKSLPLVKAGGRFLDLSIERHIHIEAMV